MTIIEAVREAMRTRACITTPEWENKVKIRPTNGPDCCIPMYWDGSKPGRKWNPSAHDLTRDDWIVVKAGQVLAQGESSKELLNQHRHDSGDNGADDGAEQVKAPILRRFGLFLARFLPQLLFLLSFTLTRLLLLFLMRGK